MRHLLTLALLIVGLSGFSPPVVFGELDKSGVELTLECRTISSRARSRADLEIAISKCKEALAVFQKANSGKGVAIASNNLGAIYDSLGEYSTAINYFELSLPTFQMTGDVWGEGGVLNNIGAIYTKLGRYIEATDYFGRSVSKFKQAGDVKSESVSLNNHGGVYANLGWYSRAIECFERSLEIFRKTGDIGSEGVTLNNLGTVYVNLGAYSKAMDCFQRSLKNLVSSGDIQRQIGALCNSGSVYASIGQHARALEYYGRSLKAARDLGDLGAEGSILGNIADLHAQQGDYDEAIKTVEMSLTIEKKTGAPTVGTTDLLANYYLDAGNVSMAESLIGQTGYNLTRARLALIRSEYDTAIAHYAREARRAEETGQVNVLFTSLTGLGEALEGLQDYKKAGDFYERAIRVLEDIRAGLSPVERRNFFEVRSRGFKRSDPAKGLTRVRMKLGDAEGSIQPGELTKARTFSDYLGAITVSTETNVPNEVRRREQLLEHQLAALRKDLQKTDQKLYPDKYKNLKKLVEQSEIDYVGIIEKLWREFPNYAAVKHPRPVALRDSGLGTDEYAVIYDVSSRGVAVRLCLGKQIRKYFFLEISKEELERDIARFRDPMQKLEFGHFNVELAKSLYRRLFGDILADVPKGNPLTIIPDGLLAILPFEALVVGGSAVWKKDAQGFPYPEGLTFLVDEHPVSYYQSLTALTLERTVGSVDRKRDSMLVLADPVFSDKDVRANQRGENGSRNNENELKTEPINILSNGEHAGMNLDRLPKTQELADKLKEIYGDNCLVLTGLEANKSKFMNKIAPELDSFGNIVFATHASTSLKTPGIVEPFLALTMSPPETDGLLKMSDVLTLRMKADMVALTACQTGLGKDVSGEGIMSLGRAFQYVGAKSVLMTLWEVDEDSAVKLTEKFFSSLKYGLSKLDSLQAARDDIRSKGYKHPYFWSGFILVGETN